MAGKRRTEVTQQDVSGLKYFDKLAPLLARLHDDACQRDAAGNRTLHYDQYCMLVLLFLFNPIVTSLRGLQQASELEKVRKRLGSSRISLGSFSEAASVFDPDRLKEIIAAEVLNEVLNGTGPINNWTCPVYTFGPACQSRSTKPIIIP